MSHEKAIRDLKAFTKVATHDLAPKEFVDALKCESDRGAIILSATMIDDRLAMALRQRMPNINADEAARIFGVEGIAGSFASRLKLAQALDIIDRPTRKFIELIREMRNACAHSRQIVSFSTPVIRTALASMMADRKDVDATAWPDEQARDVFCLLCGAICSFISGDKGDPVTRSFEIMKRYVRDQQ